MIWSNTQTTEWDPQAGMQLKRNTRSLLQRKELSMQLFLHFISTQIHKIILLSLYTFRDNISRCFSARSCHFHTLFFSHFATNNAVWLLLNLSHLHCLYLLVAAVPGDESAVFSSRQQRAIPQRAQSKDAALVSSLDDMADAISACVTEMGWDGWGGLVGQTERSTAWRD